MKTIGIITIHNCQNNYGGALQCFALYRYLQTQGYSVEVIDLHRPNNADYIDSIRFRRMRSHIGVREFIKGWLKELFGIRCLHNPKFHPNWNPSAGTRFASFNSLVKMSPPYCYIPDLYKNPPKYDVYITGSDQLWNPDQPYCLEPYFLTFVKNREAIKLSYGTSIGLSKISKKEESIFRNWLASYDVISVREQQASKLLESITSRKIYRVPDPTFLLDPCEWLQMAVIPPTKQDYVLIFNLGQNEKMIQAGIKIAHELRLKLKVIDQNYSLPQRPDVEVIADAGPLEFIGLIRNARLVLTNSFHCTVFSIITGVYNFYTYIAPESDRGSRIVDLLEIFQLSDHIIHSIDAIPSAKQLSDLKIDTERTYAIMKQEQQIGRDFLRKAISIKK